jgi:superoxide dismutase, Fe-Mn family
MSHDHVDRRTALAALGAAGLGAFASSAAARQDDDADEPVTALDLAELGYDSEANRYTLPPLPYAYDALEPHIDEQTMRIHHDKHHAGYVRGLNNAIEKLEAIRRGEGDASLMKHWSRELSFHGGGHVNHTLFWHGMRPASDGPNRPSGTLARAIDESFGSFDAFKAHFAAAAGSVEASGWGWLAYEPVARQLLVVQMEKQQNMLFTGLHPLLGVDVWEHAYYLKYQNRRSEYIDNWFNVINWPFVGRLFNAAQAGRKRTSTRRIQMPERQFRRGNPR